MNVVEFLVESPSLFRVVDFEPAIRGYPRWLYRREVSTSDMHRRMCFCKFDSPETSAGTDV